MTELNEGYYRDAVGYLEAAEEEMMRAEAIDVDPEVIDNDEEDAEAERAESVN